MAQLAREDAFSGLAPANIVRSVAPVDEAWLQLYDPAEPTAAELAAVARATESAALAIEGVASSDGGRVTARDLQEVFSVTVTSHSRRAPGAFLLEQRVWTPGVLTTISPKYWPVPTMVKSMPNGASPKRSS